MPRDYLLDDDGDLAIRAGDFAFGEASKDNVDLLLRTEPGEVKFSPLTGVGIISFLRGVTSPLSDAELERVISLQLEADGSANSKVEVKNGVITIKHTNYK